MHEIFRAPELSATSNIVLIWIMMTLPPNAAPGAQITHAPRKVTPWVINGNVRSSAFGLPCTG